jgi:hypothetical protein
MLFGYTTIYEVGISIICRLQVNKDKYSVFIRGYLKFFKCKACLNHVELWGKIISIGRTKKEHGMLDNSNVSCVRWQTEHDGDQRNK